MRPLQTLSSLTPAAVTGGVAVSNLGNIPLGAYKGGIAFWDLDKAVNQPLVAAEQAHILGILDGRLEGLDLVTVTIPLGGAVNSNIRGRLTVPAGEVWFVSAVKTVTPADSTGSAYAYWRCNLWADYGTIADPDGLNFNATQYNGAGGVTTYDEFGPWTTLVAVTNKTSLLRLPAGAKVTLDVTCKTGIWAAGSGVNTLQLFGFRGKALVA